MNDSRIAQQWEDKGMGKGRAQGTMVGQIRLCQEMLLQPLTTEKDLLALPEKDLANQLDQLRKQLRSRRA